MNIAQLVETHAATRPHAVAVIEGDALMRYGDLGRAVRSAAAWLQRAGVGPGDLVGITLGQAATHLITVLALARLGATSVPVNAGLPAETRRAICARYKVPVVVSARKGAAPAGVAELIVDADSFRAGATPTEVPPPVGGGVQAWRLALTSGTTGVPKAVAVSHDGFLEGTRLQETLAATRLQSRLVSFLDLNSSAGLGPALRQWLTGRTLVIVPSGKPAAFFDAVDRFGVLAVQTSPAILRALADAVRGELPRCPGLERLFIVGAPMTPTMQARVRARISPNLYSRYGSTEAGLISVATPEDMQREPASVGRVVPWSQVEVVDENDRPLPPGSTGILRVRTPEMPAQGYHDDPEANAQTFRNGWMYLGDLGSVGSDGLLTLQGRADDLLNVGGVKVNPADVEAVLAGHPSIAEAGVFAAQMPGGRARLLAAVVARQGFDEKAVLAFCRERLGTAAPERLLTVPQLPRNAAGKLMRHELSQRVRIRQPGDRGDEGGVLPSSSVH